MKKIILLLSFAVLSVAFTVLNKTSAPSRPNVLFLVMDDAGLDMSVHGSSYVETPNFDNVARNGVLFANAYTPNAKCAPSRSCILTGRNSWQLDAAANHVIYFPPKFKTYAETLAENGYKIGYTGKGYAPGKAFYADGSNRELLGPNYSKRKLTPPTQYISTNDYTANFKDFLTETDTNSPWCFWIGFTEPHRFYEYGSGVKKGNKSLNDIQHVPDYWPDVDSVRNDMLDYAYEIEYVDKHVGQVLAVLRQNGTLDNTIVIYTSDHGMPFPRVKGNQYENANHVPLAIMWPDGISTSGRDVSDYVSFIDLAPTLLEAAGIDKKTSGMQPIAGRSLIPLLHSSKSGSIDITRNFVLVGQERHDIGRPNDVGYPIRGMHKNGLLYLRNYETSRWPACNPETGYLNCDGGATKSYILNQRRNGTTKKYWSLNFGKRSTEELYDTVNDPNCVNNLAEIVKYQSIKENLRGEMESKLLAEGDLRMIGYGHIYESYPQVEMPHFYERFMSGEKLKTGWVNDSDFEKEPIED
jgi:hypothetical protein